MFPGRGGGGRSEAVRGWPLSARIVSVGEVFPFIIPLCCWAAAAAAATACCCWMSFLEALPRFFLSRAYSHFSVKSDQSSTNHPPRKQRLAATKTATKTAKAISPGKLTDTMLAWELSVTFRPELVALVACPTDSSPDRPRCCRAIHLLPVNSTGITLRRIVWMMVTCLFGRFLGRSRGGGYR